MELAALRGVGPARIQNLSAVGILSLRDLLYTFPLRYEDHDTFQPCAIQTEGLVQVRGKIIRPPVLQRFHGLTRVSCQLRDDSGIMPAQWFNSPWMMQALRCGETIRLYGRLISKNGRRCLQNPRIVTDSGLIPVYRKVPGIPQKSFRSLMEQAVRQAETIHPEILPEEFRQQHHLCSAETALREIHFPSSPESLGEAKRRINFEQMLLYLVYVAGAADSQRAAPPMVFPQDYTDQYWSTLPFAPTGAQRRVLREIAADLTKDRAMKRLVQGDVGCGKTAIAFGAIALACRAGFQCAMMAPTEILAQQHFQEACLRLEGLGVRCRLLTGSTKAGERKEILRELAEGACDAVFGTQALISPGVAYRQLGLVITDEQHRFGVNQRTSLERKGADGTIGWPHVLVMSATPIPRSLALILYGDLDLSVVDEMPEGRIPVQTRIVSENRREDLYRYLAQEIRKGKQAYIVCPKVDSDGDLEEGEDAPAEDESTELRTAKGVYAELKKGAFGDTDMGLTWGAQKSDEKNRTLQDFKDGRTRVLVATTVVEVGVNNPHATIMIIENAERFGLSQLHQLRGRVGRGREESWCFLVSDREEKLRILRQTNDGFLVSQKDLEQRGPGEIIGTRQSGHLDEAAAATGGDIRLLDEASRTVQALRRGDTAEEKQLLQALQTEAAALFEDREIGIN